MFVQIGNHICLNCKLYLSKSQFIFVQIANYICPNRKLYLSKIRIIFVRIAKCICSNSCISAGGNTSSKVDEGARLGETKRATVAGAVGVQFLKRNLDVDDCGGRMKF